MQWTKLSRFWEIELRPIYSDRNHAIKSNITIVSKFVEEEISRFASNQYTMASLSLVTSLYFFFETIFFVTIAKWDISRGRSIAEARWANWLNFTMSSSYLELLASQFFSSFLNDFQSSTNKKSMMKLLGSPIWYAWFSRWSISRRNHWRYEKNSRRQVGQAHEELH